MHMEDDEEREGEYKLPRHKLLDLTEGGGELNDVAQQLCDGGAAIADLPIKKRGSRERETTIIIFK